MSRPLIAIVPKTISDGDKILLKGLVKDDAYEFSINFVNGTDPNPQDIIYHFKTIVPDNVIVENCKQNGDWMEEQVKDWPSSDGPGFALEFAFSNGCIYTYLVADEQARNLITFYEHDSELSDINSVQVWGDVKKIQQLTFQFS